MDSLLNWRESRLAFAGRWSDRPSRMGKRGPDGRSPESGFVHRALTWGVVCLLALSVSGCGGRRSQQYVEEGNTYLRLGDVSAAEASFTRALEANPNNAEAHLGFARCCRLRGDAGKAIEEYRKAIALDSSLANAYAEGIRLLIAQGATEEAGALARAFSDADAEQGGILRAHVLTATGKREEAVTILEELHERFSSSEQVAVALAQAYLAAGKADQAEQLLNGVLQDVSGDSLMARMALVETYQTQGKLPEMIEQLRAMSEQRPDNRGIQLALARSLLDSGQAEEAETIARPILAEVPESPWANYVVGSCLLAQGDFIEATRCLQIAAHAFPERAEIARKLAQAEHGGEPATPAAGSGQADEQGAVAASWRELWNSGRLNALLQNRERLLQQEDASVLETLTMAAVFAGNMQIVEELKNRLAGDSPVKKFIEALENHNAEELGTSIESWSPKNTDEELLKLNATGFAFAAMGARSQALKVFENCLERWPDNAMALLNMASVYRAAQMPEYAARCLQRLAGDHPQNDEARFYLFRILLDAKLLSEARRSAETAYATFPENGQAVVNLARIYRETGENDLAIEVLDRAVVTQPDDGLLRLVRAETLLVLNRVDDAAEAFKNVEVSGPLTGRVSAGRAFVAARANDWEVVLNACQSAGEEVPTATRLLETAALVTLNRASEAAKALAEADGSPRDPVRTGVVLEALGVTLPEDAPGRNPEWSTALAGKPEALASLAYGLSCEETGQRDEAVKAFGKVDEIIPGNPHCVALLMRNAARMTSPKERLQVAERYTQKYPEMPAAWIGIAGVHESLGDRAQARKALDRAYELAPGDVSVLLKRAEFFEPDSELVEAERTYRELVTLLPGQPLMKNNLAYSILRLNGDASEALRLAQEANEAGPPNGYVLHTLGLAQLRNGMAADAEKTLRMALEMRPGDPTLLLDYGQAAIALGNAEQGKEYVEQAVRYATQLNLDFPRMEEAKQLLEQH